MGMIRKTLSVATMGMGVSYRSKKEQEKRHKKQMKKELKAQTKLLEEQNEILRRQD